jgi:hypothetical protein
MPVIQPSNSPVLQFKGTLAVGECVIVYNTASKRVVFALPPATASQPYCFPAPNGYTAEQDTQANIKSFITTNGLTCPVPPVVTAFNAIVTA